MRCVHTGHEHAYVLNVMSDDHPGIVSAVSGAVGRLGGNIDACSQTVLGGYFTLIMIVSFAEAPAAERLAAEVRGPGGEHAEFQVQVRPFVLVGSGESAPAERFVVTAFGEDRPGVICRFSEYLAGKGINIVDLYGYTEPGGAGGEPAGRFVLISQVDIPRRLDLAMLQADLEAMGREQGFTVRLQHENIFVATNQLRFARPPD